MKFNEKLQMLRKEKGFSQEQLAEALDISRQAVSKWEAGMAYPEFDKLTALADLYEVSLDDLLREDHGIQKSELNGKEAYEKHYQFFSRMIASGVGLLSLGAIAMSFLIVKYQEHFFVPLLVFFLFVVLSLPIFIYAGIQHEEYMKNEDFEDFYPKEEKYHFTKKFAFALCIGGVLILLGIIPLLLGYLKDFFPFSVLLIGGSLPLFAYFGIQKEKYDMVEVKSNRNSTSSLIDRCCGAIMLFATALFLYLGIVQNMWHPGWIVFPIGGILCGILETLLEKRK